jgi:hypothetical protein
MSVSNTSETTRSSIHETLCTAVERMAFESGDEVIWWKRIPGGDYVYPLRATVLATSAKRVKIVADDDGAAVVRYVQPESLQRRS